MPGWLDRLRGARAADVGRQGERLAARWLRRRGYLVLERNLRLGRDEVDLLVLDPDGRTVVLVEVKTRTVATPPPEDSLTTGKGRSMTRAAGRLAGRSEFAGRPMRLDAIAIVWPPGGRPRVRHYRSAFEP